MIMIEVFGMEHSIFYRASDLQHDTEIFLFSATSFEQRRSTTTCGQWTTLQQGVSR